MRARLPVLYFSLIQVDVRVENAEPLLKNLFGEHTHSTAAGESTAPGQSHMQSRRTRRKSNEGQKAETEKCLSSSKSLVDQAKAMVRLLEVGRCGSETDHDFQKDLIIAVLEFRPHSSSIKLNVQVQIREHECVSQVSIKCKKLNVLGKTAVTYLI